MLDYSENHVYILDYPLFLINQERGYMNYDRLKAYMRQHGLSVSELERLCGVANATIRNWNPENKGYKPKAETLNQVAKKTGIPIEELL